MFRAFLIGAMVAGSLAIGIPAAADHQCSHLTTGGDYVSCTYDGQNLSGVVLGGADFRNSTFVGTNLSRARLNGAVFRDSDLENANLSAIAASGVDILDSSLVGASFTNAVLNGAKFGGSDMTDATLLGATGTIYFQTAILCNTTMPDGTVDNSGC